MAGNRISLAPGLYFLATPIGTARDITLRALDILASAEVLFAEDTRSLRKLMDIHGIALDGRRVFSYHDHSKPADRARVLEALEAGKSVAYASEAGTPLVADPGYQLARAAIEGGHNVISAPGPSAVLAALTVSGLATDRFFFAGFPPNSTSARQKFLSEMSVIPGTLIFYESPKRVHGLLDDLVQTFGGQRSGVVARELTKKFEEVLRGALTDLVSELQGRNLKGEIVVLVERASGNGDPAEREKDMRRELEKALETMSVKDAASVVSEALNLPRRKVYQAALELSK